jgi:hypothetical protein
LWVEIDQSTSHCTGQPSGIIGCPTAAHQIIPMQRNDEAEIVEEVPKRGGL